MMVSIQRYPITIQYRPRKELLIADTLSLSLERERAPINAEATELEIHEYDINILYPLNH